MKVLITGGSGYLGQFLIQRLAENQTNTVAFTYNSQGAIAELVSSGSLGSNVTGHLVDLINGQGLEDCLAALGMVDLIINCAAVSQPGVCEKDPELARAVNVPSTLLSWPALKTQVPPPLLIHISTDQVYSGIKANSIEADAGAPVNTYGKSKLEAEQLIQDCWPNHVILRSSIIYGCPPPFTPVPRPLFLQWMEGALRGPDPIDFFHDEWRSPIFVHDIVKIITLLSAHIEDYPFSSRVYNMGGPERLSRVDMATKLATLKKFDLSKIQSVSSSTINRGVVSPPDISMNIKKIQADLGLEIVRFDTALAMIFP
mmetsp:Transcript_22484/g.31275  ORF Transcript_22484/g.31275 Transcript_22484/m.31275 type:complete len:314 (+) Transcript_22484:102-1043(+)|eukprot:CAMPEP_0196590714 /NCGR_PEP_ID=MMETSP1081-20130531/67344_1 /TAXON_ID=36882 /ORGANISM="Pyramimonas amylifera, Strain CCMP720" /LENGTH=313 /DNA_ID=CAMNT_0041913885 /DNA_START=102 /DNA_END=1043 /DNA_ORIENTATION=+